MRVMYFPKFNFILLVIASLLALTAYADDVDDAVNELHEKSKGYTAESHMGSINDFLKEQPKDSSEDIAAQLRDIESDYKNKIDAHALNQKNDALANNLANKRTKGQDLVVKHVEVGTAENSKSRKETQQDVASFQAATTPKEDVSDFANSGRKTKSEDASFETEDFGDVVSNLSMVDVMKDNLERPQDNPDPQKNDKVLLFKGENLSCDRIKIGKIKDCCDMSGILRNIVGGKCPAHVKEVLAPAVHRENRCYEIGRHCEKKIVGRCFRERQTYCCYKSNLAKIFQEIAHDQLGISWGSSRSPNCDPLDPKIFTKLNFEEENAKNLLKGLVKNAQDNAQQYHDKANANVTTNEAEIMHKVTEMQKRIAEYFKNIKRDKE